jgi:hypothetical protein
VWLRALLVLAVILERDGFRFDVTWTRTDMAALRGCAAWPEASYQGSTRRWKTRTFLAALRRDRIDAPWFLEGPIDGESFRLYVEKVLLPTLRPGDIVIMNNLGSHRSRIARQLIRSAEAKPFFLPKYSPYLNPIEQVSNTPSERPQPKRRR